MRKHLLLPSLLAIGVISLGSSFAFACDGKAKSTSTASASAGKCAGKADLSTASVDGKTASAADCSAACMAACEAAKSASAAGHCGSAASVQTAGAAGHCNGAAMKTADGACAAQADFFVSNYMCMSKAAAGHCNVSMQTAAATWNEGLQKVIVSGQAAEHTASLKLLSGLLADWPADAASAQARMSAISEWTARYCELFPEKTAGAKVMTCPETGKRWVEVATASADGQS